MIHNRKCLILFGSSKKYFVKSSKNLKSSCFYIQIDYLCLPWRIFSCTYDLIKIKIQKYYG